MGSCLSFRFFVRSRSFEDFLQSPSSTNAININVSQFLNNHIEDLGILNASEDMFVVEKELGLVAGT